MAVDTLPEIRERRLKAGLSIARSFFNIVDDPITFSNWDNRPDWARHSVNMAKMLTAHYVVCWPF